MCSLPLRFVHALIVAIMKSRAAWLTLAGWVIGISLSCSSTSSRRVTPQDFCRKIRLEISKVPARGKTQICGLLWEDRGSSCCWGWRLSFTPNLFRVVNPKLTMFLWLVRSWIHPFQEESRSCWLSLVRSRRAVQSYGFFLMVWGTGPPEHCSFTCSPCSAIKLTIVI